MGEAQRRVGKRIEDLERENQSLRDALFSILKHQGRVRIPKAVANSLQQGDGMSVRELGDSWVFTFEPSNMVVPQGVKDGQANGAA